LADPTSWEMSTVGHPLSDLTNMFTPYLSADANTSKSQSEFKPGATPGLPTQAEVVRWYADVAGWDPASDVAWGAAFAMFRLTCIFQGIAARYAVRQASSAQAKETGALMHPWGQISWDLVNKAKAAARTRARL
jgi:aminoglycoside phosphotransferase (APT) family kinase protein